MRWVDPAGGEAASAQVAPGEGERAAALRAWRDAQIARDAAERRLRELADSLAPAVKPPSRPVEPDHDGWAPRDLPLLPSPIHRQLLPEGEEAGGAGADTLAALEQLPAPGTLPDLSYVAAWKRPFVRALGRFFLAVGAFLAIPQRQINAEIRRALAEIRAENQALRHQLAVVAERSMANFTFLDEAQRDHLLEIHRQNARVRSDIQGELLRRLESQRADLERQLTNDTPRHQLALLELELAVAEARSQAAWLRLLATELEERVEAAEQELDGR